MRKLGPEVARSHERRIYSGFYVRFMSGKGLDFGYRGEIADASPVLDTAIGIELGTPGYDGIHLQYPAESFDYIFSSHCLEHLPEPEKNIREWYRLTKIGGHIVIIVPHKYLYERRETLPSRWNEDHKQFFAPYNLLMLVDLALEPNSYRVVHLFENDVGYDYSIPLDQHPNGSYEIELVLRKIQKPTWEIEQNAKLVAPSWKNTSK